jgi:hypothetical protein
MRRKIYFLLVCVALPLFSFGQDAPRWLHSHIREQAYPADAWFTGFAEGNVRQNETSAAAAARLKKEAQGLLAESIRVSVESATGSLSRSTKINHTEQLTAVFESAVYTAAQADIVGVKTESWYDADENTVYAFAWVNKAKMVAYYQNQIALYLNKMESALNTASELAEKGAKTKARRQCEEVVKHFATVAYAQDLLTAINPQADDTALQQQRGERLRNALVQTLTDLENSIYVYVECTETVNGQTVVHIADRLPGLLTEQGCGCNFTDLPEEADYVVKVKAQLARCTDTPDNVSFCYATATASVYNAHTQKTLMPKIPETKGGWTDKNRAKATEEAFGELAGEIVEGTPKNGKRKKVATRFCISTKYLYLCSTKTIKHEEF